MPPPITTTSKLWPAISSMARARLSIGPPSPSLRAPASALAPASIEEGDGRGGGTLGHRPLLARVAEVQETDRALLRRQPERRAALLAAQQAGGPPVAGEAAGVGGEQNDVGGDRGRVQVLLVLDGVADEPAGDGDEGRAAVELGGALGPGRLLQPRQRRRAKDAEAPGHGEVVVRRPVGELQQLLQLAPRQRRV